MCNGEVMLIRVRIGGGQAGFEVVDGRKRWAEMGAGRGDSGSIGVLCSIYI